jgi:type I site-specific restriction endonuclease
MPELNPEQVARQQIDALLSGAGWAVQDYKQFAPSAALRIARREAPLKSGTCIVAEVERRLSVVEELKSELATNIQRTTRLRQSILQQAFAGKL